MSDTHKPTPVIVVVSIIWLLLLQASVIVSALQGNPIALGMLFFEGCVALLIVTLLAAVQVFKYFDRS